MKINSKKNTIIIAVIFATTVLMFTFYVNGIRKIISTSQQTDEIRFSEIETKIANIDAFLQNVNQKQDKLVTKFQNTITEPESIKTIHKDETVVKKILNTNNSANSEVIKHDDPYESMESRYLPQTVMLENKFLGEAIDYEYASVEEKRVTKIITTDKYKGTKIKSTECKTRICKIVVEHKDDKIAGIFMDTIAESLNFKGESTMQVMLDANGKEVTVLYYAKSGKLVEEWHFVVIKIEHGASVKLNIKNKWYWFVTGFTNTIIISDRVHK